ncbi:protein Wnt-5-like isoform X1 [Anopheles albimanus]|uniref:Protein Wnt n=1 Tax=Anopheles albimanus TaxID=7167 RepID=A0A8W7JWZ4_ANOAL|nr:protein Wnt-5-like isoform X1 [Anopheles albimanus]
MTRPKLVIMEFRKYYNVWILMYGVGFLLPPNAAFGVSPGQGVPTWIYLGIKSPFIVFRSENEILSNNSVLLNITEIRNKLKYVQSLDHFIRPIGNSQIHKTDQKVHNDESNGETLIGGNSSKQYNSGTPDVSSALYALNVRGDNISAFFLTTESPSYINHFGKQSQEIIRPTSVSKFPNVMANADHMISDDDGQQIERKYIIPLALKTSTNEKEKTSSVFHGSSTNIDDLKRHILMLQNLTQSDKNFQSKFVVFPSLQKNESTTSRPPLLTTVTVSSIASNKQQTTLSPSSIQTKEYWRKPAGKPTPISQSLDKITIIPQVLVQNDQTSETGRDKEGNLGEVSNKFDADKSKEGFSASSAHGRMKMYNTEEKSFVTNVAHKSTTSSITYLTEVNYKGKLVPTRKLRRKNQRNASEANSLHKKVSEMNIIATTTESTTIVNKERAIKKQNKNNRRVSGIGRRKQPTRTDELIDNPYSPPLHSDLSSQTDIIKHISGESTVNGSGNLKLYESTTLKWTKQRIRRNDNGERQSFSRQDPKQYRSLNTPSHHLTKSRRTEGRMLGPVTPFSIGVSGYMHNSGDEGYVHNSDKSEFNDRNRTIPVAAYYEKDVIDLNPDLCYSVSALSGGQQKLCAQHTSIMPAISRGARAAIQECKHQFRNRRWNCSIVDDVTVFGPISNIGSPEIAFIYALAAAAASSFIARACRDGQLASCGCSRSLRPTKLNEDWTWGGCGDDMEFGYKFSQTFIDIKEKEKKRGTRGLVSIPAKYPKIIEQLLDAFNDTTKNGAFFNETIRPEDLVVLQKKIATEIEKSNLTPREMNDLQERIYKEVTNSEVFNLKNVNIYERLKKMFRKPDKTLNGVQFSASAKARALMNLHNNEAGRRAVIKKSRIICKCHGVSGSCSLITCWQQLTSIREIGDFLREKYDEATQVKVNKRGRLQVKDPRYRIPSALDLIYLDESPDWCRVNRQLKWLGTHGRVCNKTSSGLDGCSILCCGRGYNTKKIVVKERCNCKFQWCCQVKCETCTKTIEEYTCK